MNTNEVISEIKNFYSNTSKTSPFYDSWQEGSSITNVRIIAEDVKEKYCCALITYSKDGKERGGRAILWEMQTKNTKSFFTSTDSKMTDDKFIIQDEFVVRMRGWNGKFSSVNVYEIIHGKYPESPWKMELGKISFSAPKILKSETGYILSLELVPDELSGLPF